MVGWANGKLTQRGRYLMLKGGRLGGFTFLPLIRGIVDGQKAFSNEGKLRLDKVVHHPKGGH